MNERSPMEPPFCAAVDWGTTSFRLWLLGAGGDVVAERRSREGMQACAETGFAPVLEAHLAALGAPADLPAVVCGMAGARQGWVEAPYADTPASLDDLAAGAIRVPDTAREVRILPGVAQRAGGRADVMRGEETQIMGLSGDEDATVCLPGTHSKWALLKDRRIAAFSTFMTGEVFALLSGQSILRHATEAGADVLSEPDAFAAGVEASLLAPDLTLNRLFALRAAGLFGAATPAETTARLSGLLIGLELAGARRLHPAQGRVLLAASGTMRDLYAAGLSVAGFEVRTVDADAAVRKGLFDAARHCFTDRLERLR